MRIAIAGGGGGVGASVAFNLLIGPGNHQVALLDRRPEMAASHQLDLEQVLEQAPGGAITVGGDEDLAAADVVIVTAAAPLTVNESRMVYLEANARILAAVCERLPSGWPGILLVVTNPVDPLCTWLVRTRGLDRRRVLGYTLNDSLRLRTGVGRVRGIAPGRVDAWMLGEHGDLAVPLWDRVTIDGVPAPLSDSEQARALEFVRTWYVRHVALDSGRSSTWTSGYGVARMVRALASGDGGGGAAAPTGGADRPWPASVVLDGEYGVAAISLSVPVSLSRAGATVHEWELTGAEHDALAQAASFVDEAASGISV